MSVRGSWISTSTACWAISSTRAITGCLGPTPGFAGGTAAWARFDSIQLLVKKNYILDTNVLLHDPDSLLSFEENNVLLPIEVIEEIDRFKRESTELGQNARTVSRMLDGFRGEGRLSEGIRLPNGGRLRIIFQKPHSARNGHAVFSTDSVDNRILSLAFNVKKSLPKGQTILVSKDI